MFLYKGMPEIGMVVKSFTNLNTSLNHEKPWHEHVFMF